MSDDERNRFYKRWVDAVAEVANKVFDLDGCCHFETVCSRIEALKSERDNLIAQARASGLHVVETEAGVGIFSSKESCHRLL